MISERERVLADLRRLHEEIVVMLAINVETDDPAALALLEAVLDDADRALERWRRLRAEERA